MDLPERAEREDIFRLHLARRGRDPAGFDLARLAGAAEEFSGAEIEAAVVGGLYRAFAAGGMLSEIENTVPLSRARREDLAALRSWAEERALAA